MDTDITTFFNGFVTWMNAVISWLADLVNPLGLGSSFGSNTSDFIPDNSALISQFMTKYENKFGRSIYYHEAKYLEAHAEQTEAAFQAWSDGTGNICSGCPLETQFWNAYLTERLGNG